jgi:hypothetical protein
LILDFSSTMRAAVLISRSLSVSGAGVQEQAELIGGGLGARGAVGGEMGFPGLDSGMDASR